METITAKIHIHDILARNIDKISKEIDRVLPPYYTIKASSEQMIKDSLTTDVILYYEIVRIMEGNQYLLW